MSSSQDTGGAASGEPNDQLVTFLTTIASEDGEGEVELRLIVDKRGGDLVGRHWFSSPCEVAQAMPELMATAEAHAAAVFFGVLRRRAKGVGTSADCVDGRVVWNDLDFKDFAGGESEARRRLDAFPLVPSFLLRSGHGLHPYWLLRESAAPELLSQVSKVVGKVLGGDHTHDAARILRLPGTFNRKDPAHPIRVEFERFEPDRCVNLSELQDAAELVGAQASEERRKPAPADEPEYEEPAKPPVSDRVLGLIQRKKRIGLLFNGQGKPELDANGAELDRSSSGYDFSFVLALVKIGVTDEDELKAALANRPDGAALAKGPRYLKKTVSSALAMQDEIAGRDAEDAEFQLDFELQEIRLFDSNPARYSIKVQDVTFVLTSSQLRSAAAFSIAFLDAVHRLPSLPSSTDAWRTIVNKWLAGAVVVEQPPDASREPRFVEAVMSAVANLPVGDAVEDLGHGKAFALADGRSAFKTLAILRLMRDDWPNIEAEDVSRVLRTSGYTSATTMLDGVKTRVWSRPDERS